MSLYINGKIKDVMFGNQRIKEIYCGSQKIYSYLHFPVDEPLPSTYSESLYDSVSGQNYKIGTITESGFYRITTRAETGDGQWSSARGGATGGCISDAIVYLYENSKYIIWGANRRYTGYPSPATVLGGTGGNVTWTEAGGGGGGAGNKGNIVHSDAGAGGGGAGCIVGINNDGATLTESWNHGGFSVNSVECMVLAGGGGSNSGDNGEPRPGGAGGGAWGNGGENSYASGSSGPGGNDFGRGGCNYGYWAGPGQGAWCLRDYTRSQWSSGVGIKSGSSGSVGTTCIYKLIYNVTTYNTLTIATTPSDATVTFNTAGTISGKSITVPTGSTISYNVTRTGYVSKNNLTHTVNADETINAPALDKDNFTLTVNTDPVDATVTFSTGTVSQDGHSVTVPYETTITYTISKTGYATSQTYTKIVTQNETITAPALVQEAFKITYPDDARLALTNINGNIYQNNNMVKLSITTSRSFKIFMTDINRYITGYWEESNVLSAWFEKNTTLYLSSTYTTGSSFNRKTYFYDRTITLTEDTSFTVTDADYWRIS